MCNNSQLLKAKWNIYFLAERKAIKTQNNWIEYTAVYRLRLQTCGAYTMSHVRTPWG